MKKHSRYACARGFLIFWCLFIGIGAVAGATGMLVKPDGSAMGMQALLPYFQVLPFAGALFQNFIFPGIALLCVNGLPNLIAAALLIRRKRGGATMGGILGITLMAWITIQFVIFPANFMSTTYFIFGALQAATGYAARVFQAQERFAAEQRSYPNIGARPERLVVYFSRMGYVRRIASETADATGASLLEIHATERTEGTPGFWWCGRYGMHGWSMPIEAVNADLSAYAQVTICAPVWVFGLAGPMRSFCAAASGKIRSADYVLVHHMRAPFVRIADQMDAMLGLKRTGFRSVCCRTGHFREIVKN